MIPDLPKSISRVDMLDFYEKYAARLDGQSGVHVMWHTHKRDPSVCWICDSQILTYKVLEICKDIIQSRSLDIETALGSESDLESEIDVSDDDEEEEMLSTLPQDYNEPEFDVEDES